MSNFCIIILAAGEGKRMKSNLPKVLHEIHGKPMVNYIVEAALALKPKKTVVVIGRKRPEVKSVLPSNTRVVFQDKPLGTADAVKAAQKEISANVSDVMILYGDTPLVTEETIRTLYDFHKSRNAACTVLTTFLERPRGYGRILRNEAGSLVGIVEDKDANFSQKGIKEINTGMYCFKKDDLLEALAHVKSSNQAGEFYLTDALSYLFHRNRKIDACIAEDSSQVLGVNSQMELLSAADVLRKRILEKWLERGVRIMDPQVTFIDASVQIGAGSVILPFSFIEKDVVIGRQCSVGPFCHLREGTVLKDRVSVGNFTEIKNSVLGEDTWMRHLGYLGDTTVGQKVNIGAGTVVANFDGKKKNKTTIKDRAFIGCDAVLVAPVVVGRKSFVGAGSVVTKNHNVADGATVVGVPARPIDKPRVKR